MKFVGPQAPHGRQAEPWPAELPRGSDNLPTYYGRQQSPPILVRLFVRAHAIRARLLQDPSLTLKEIAAEEGVVSSYVSRLVRLAFLAPDIVTAILNGRHPPQLTANRLMDDTRLPLDWRAQRELLFS